MGLITKVRGRVKNTSKLTQAQQKILKLRLSKNGIADSPNDIYYSLLGCPRNRKSSSSYENFQKNPETLILLLLLPLMMGRIGLLYACFIYQYPLHTIYDWSKKWFHIGYSHVKSIGGKLYKSLEKCENSFVNMNLYTIVNQMVFFMVCDRAVGLEDKQRVTSMYSLLFYNVLTYCLTYVKEVIEKEDWSMSVNLTPSSKVRHLAMSTTKLVLEWIKAVTFIVTVVCMLLLLGLEQGLEHYSPTRFYVLITLIYYILTEKIIQDSLPNLLIHLPSKRLQDEIFGQEKKLSTLAIKVLTVCLNILLLLPTFPSIKITLISAYFNIWLQYKSSMNLRSELETEFGLVSNFRMATDKELEIHDDVCSICLGSLEFARVTPCQHLFHSNCLRLCVKNANNTCPICKREFHFD